ncbi:hypothetical protein MSG28_010188 [Choristoneura fumiferana]|uniref:Uncharacterized protein n=1 Tax=Choristoneura fumiferana TaxID=7141 RepID=A0ACC0KKM5_CHOFU|nr:hypothetical protein MSG28_010188 [Choristoneura fumiferana]
MLEVTCNDRLGKKVRVKCNPDDTVGDLKKLIAAQTGTRYDKIVLKKWYTVFKDHIKLSDYEIHDGMNLDLRPVGSSRIQTAAFGCRGGRSAAFDCRRVRSTPSGWRTPVGCLSVLEEPVERGGSRFRPVRSM